MKTWGQCVDPRSSGTPQEKSRRRTITATTNGSPGSVMTFEFYKMTHVRKISLLNVMDGQRANEIEVLHNDGAAENLILTSVGLNGYQ